MRPHSPFGDALRKLRKSCELSLVQLAKVAGCSIVHLSDIERGQRNPPANETIRAMVNFLGFPDRLNEMLALAIRSRRSVEISVEGKGDDVASMLVALQRRCDDNDINEDTARQIRELLEGGSANK